MFSDKLFINLKILSKLQANDKLDTKGTLFKIEQPGYLPIFIIRFFQGDSREHTIKRIQELIQQGSFFIEDKRNEGQKKDILDHLHKAINGLNNLKTTYMNDETTIASLEYNIDIVTRILKKYNYFPEEEINMIEYSKNDINNDNVEDIYQNSPTITEKY